MGWVTRCRALWKEVRSHLPQLPRWIATWGWAALIVAALGFEEAHEYGIALVLVLASAASLISALIRWGGVPESPTLTNTARIAGFCLSIVLLVFSLVWIWGQKGDQDWSRLPRAWVRLEYLLGVEPLTPPGIPGPGNEVTLGPLPPLDVVYVPQIQQTTSPWRVFLGTSIIRHPQGFEPGPYASNIIGCDHLVAIDYFTHVRIVNQTDKPREIQGYSFEIRTIGGKWKLLKRLFVAPSRAEWLSG